MAVRLRIILSAWSALRPISENLVSLALELLGAFQLHLERVACP